MATPPDDITRRKLLLLKQLYHRAIAQSASLLNPVDRILAVVALDLCIETQLKIVVSSLDSSKTPADAFQGLIQQADAILLREKLNPLPDKANIQFVHSTRNDAQHKAKYPNEADVNDARTYTRDFLRKICTEVWNLHFDALSLASAIQHEDARRRLLQAEESISKGAITEAVQEAGAALTLALYHVESAVVGRMPSSARAIPLANAFGKPADNFDARRAFEAIEQMQDTLLYVALRMDYSQFMRFHSVVGRVFFTMNGQAHFAGMKENIELKEAEWIVAYSIDSVVNIEEIVGSIDAPFGRRSWR